ncbi:MAG TPA: hypothetical protein VK158_02870 [Acidobacteriota bacterium]|nr:hypothetical protein [Acidobacteriota bacterium]
MAWRQVPIQQTKTYQSLSASRNDALGIVKKIREQRNDANEALARQAAAAKTARKARDAALEKSAKYRKANTDLRQDLRREEYRSGYHEYIADMYRNQNTELQDQNSNLERRIKASDYDLKTEQIHKGAITNASHYVITRLDQTVASLRRKLNQYKEYLAVGLPIAAILGGIVGYSMSCDAHKKRELAQSSQPAQVQAPIITLAPVQPAAQPTQQPAQQPAQQVQQSVSEDKESKERVARILQGYSIPTPDFLTTYVPPLRNTSLQLQLSNPNASTSTPTQQNVSYVRVKPSTSAELQYYNTINNALPKDAQQALDALVKDYQGITKREVTIPANGVKPFASQDTLHMYGVNKSQSNSQKLADLADVVDMLKSYLSTANLPESKSLAPVTMYTNANDDFTLNAADAFKTSFQRQPLIVQKSNADGSTTVTIIGYRADVHKYDSKAVKY